MFEFPVQDYVSVCGDGGFSAESIFKRSITKNIVIRDAGVLVRIYAQL